MPTITGVVSTFMIYTTTTRKGISPHAIQLLVALAVRVCSSFGPDRIRPSSAAD